MYTSLGLLLLLLLLLKDTDGVSPKKHEEEPTMVGGLTTGFIPKEGEPVKHKTTLGIIEGRKEASVGSENVFSHYYAFRGIPYAHPPTDELRFADPVDAVDAWPNRYLDATRFGNVCPQFNYVSAQVVGQEDCLCLNVFTPVLPGYDTEGIAGLPVLVFIHGGGYLRASSSVLSGAQMVGQNIVLVTFNYRLGALGFLSTADNVIPGNFGLLDQVSALRWVQRNIAEFGGDPDRVTLAGFSAGAASAHSHMLSPLTKGLFHQTILVGSSAFPPWNIQKDAILTIKLFSEKIQCPPTPSAQLKPCLATKSHEDIVRAHAAIMRYEWWPTRFTPLVDAGFRENPYLPRPFRELSPHSTYPVLLSLTPDEGIPFSLNVILMSEDPLNASAIYDQIVRYSVSSFWFRPETADLVAEAAESLYYTTHAKESIEVLFEQLSEIVSDYLISAWVWEAAEKLSEEGCPVYAYMLTQRNPESRVWASALYDKAETFLKIKSPLLYEGVSHGDDLALIFSPKDFKNSKDESLARILVSNWVGFVINGSPSVAEKSWPAIEQGGPLLYYNVCENSHFSRSPFRQKETNFWVKTVPLMEEMWMNAKDQDTCIRSCMPWITGAVVTYFLFSLMNRRN